MIRVTFLKSRAGFRGGLEKYTLHLMQTFVEKGCAVTLLTTGTPPEVKDVTVHSLGPVSKFSLYHLLYFNSQCQEWLTRHPQDIVFGMERSTSQTHYRAGSGVHAVYLQRRALIDSFWKRLTFRLNPLHQALLSIEKKAFEASELKVLFTNSNMVREEILKTYKTPIEKIEVIHNGVEWNQLHIPFEQTFPRLAPHPFQFLFVGNDYKRKGLPFLLQGLAKLRHTSFRLTVVGHDKKISHFQQMASELGLKEKVFFLGAQKEMIPFYQMADVLVIPSVYDPFANVTVEALAMGLFVVSSRYNGGQEVLQNFSGTMIEDLTSAESVASALKIAFTHPKTEKSARKIRESVKELDFPIQLDKIVTKTLQT